MSMSIIDIRMRLWEIIQNLETHIELLGDPTKDLSQALGQIKAAHTWVKKYQGLFKDESRENTNA